MAQRLLILGTRTLAEEVADWARTAGFDVAGFVENLERERCEHPLRGLPVHWVDELPDLATDHLGVCAFGSTRRSRFVEEARERGVQFATVVHPHAVVSPESSIGEGSIVGPAVVVGAYTQIGSHVLLNRGVLVGHHTTIGDYSSLQPGANVAGACTIGERVYVGMAASVIDHRAIADGCLVGAGALVLEDLPAAVKALGVPAKVVETGIEPR